MPEPEEAVVDNPVEDEAQPAQVTDDGTPQKENAPVKEQLILGKFKTVEDIAKSYSEVEKEKGRLADELGQLRSKVELLSRQSKLEDAISTLAENSKVNKEEPPIDFDAWADKLAQEHNLPKEAIKEIASMPANWVKQSDNKHRAEFEELKKFFEDKIARLAENQERLDPDYQQNRELIDKMVAKGISMSVAKSIVKDLVGSSDNSSTPVSTRTEPPVTVTPTRTTTRVIEPDSKLLFSDKDLDIIRNEFPEFTEEQVQAKAKEMNARRKERIKTGQPVRSGVYAGQIERRGF